MSHRCSCWMCWLLGWCNKANIEGLSANHYLIWKQAEGRNSLLCQTLWGKKIWKMLQANAMHIFWTQSWVITEFADVLAHIARAANQYGISVFCTDFTCKIREYEFGLENTEIELCQFCHLKYCCQNKAYLFWVANQSGFVAFYALEPSNTSLITKTFKLLSSTCSSNMLSCITSCSCSTGSIH